MYLIALSRYIDSPVIDLLFFCRQSEPRPHFPVGIFAIVENRQEGAKGTGFDVLADFLWARVSRFTQRVGRSDPKSRERSERLQVPLVVHGLNLHGGPDEMWTKKTGKDATKAEMSLSLLSRVPMDAGRAKKGVAPALNLDDRCLR